MIINPENFKLKEIPKFHPLSYDYVDWWSEQKRRCIDGYWVGGQYIPGRLYFYINFGTILLQASKHAKKKSMGRPELWDIFWDLANYWMEARGFAGFEKTPGIDKVLEAINNNDEEEEERLKKEELEHPRTILYNAQHQLGNEDLGRPLYLNEAKDFMLMTNRGSGKDLKYDTLVYPVNSDPIRIIDTKVGDYIYGADGTPTKIINKEKYNDQVQYRISFRDGRNIVCGGGHHWRVYNNINRHWETKTLDEISKDYKVTKRQDPRYFIPINNAIRYDYKELKIPPYFLGLWLGNGSKHRCGITTVDQEIVEYIYSIADKFKEEVKLNYNNYKNCPTYFISNGRGKTSSLIKAFKEYNLFYNKHIPKDYLLSSVEQRMDLLRGLMDSDGHIQKEGNIEFCTSDVNILTGVKTILGSLGLRYSVSEKETSHKLTYRVNILTSENIFYLSRKKDRLSKNPSNYAKSNRDKVAITDIEKLGVDESVCISVDNKDKLFIAGDYIVTHNSYFTANAIVAHEFLFDGMEQYIPPKERDYTPTTEVLVGAGDSYYSKTLLEKVKLCINELPGGQMANGVYYPSPLSKRYEGNFLQAGKTSTSRYKKKEGNSWVWKGTGSKITHRSFKDNDFAANGTRPSVTALEEIGMFSNLESSHGPTVDTMVSDGRKFGSAIMIGCVCAGTKVFTNSGEVKNIENIKKDDGLIGKDSGGIKKQEINWFKEPEYKDCYKINTVGGNFLECSYDHPLLITKSRAKTKNGVKVAFYKEAKDIDDKDQVLIPNEIPIFGNKNIPYSRELGLMIGDGNYSNNATPSLSASEEEIYNYIKNKYGILENKKYKISESRSYSQLYIKDLKERLKEHGMYGQVKLDKRFPKDIHTFDKESLANFISGYFDADGNVYYNNNKKILRVVLTSICYELLEQMKYQLLKFGIHSSIVKEKRNKKPDKEYEGQLPFICRLYINDQESLNNFRDNISFLVKSKQEKLNKIKQSKYKSFDVEFEVNPDNNKEGYFSDDRLKGFRYNRVRSKEYIGKKKVYNLNCGPNHNYLSNGFVTRQTGGDMQEGTVDASKMFYDPDTYNILKFEDYWEHSGEIGCFIPAYRGQGKFKDDQGNTFEEKAKKELEEEREKIKQGKNAVTALQAKKQNQPLVPSEMFLTTGTNIFPTAELNEVLKKLERGNLYKRKGTVGSLRFSSDSPEGVKFEPDVAQELKPIDQFPHKSTESTEGALVIYEFPITDETGQVPRDLYIIGHDPVRTDSPEGSLNSIYVMKSRKYMYTYGYDEIVAQYVGRPDSGREPVNELLEKLSMFYGSSNEMIYFENMVGNTKEYFEKRKKLHLLARQPRVVMNKKADFGPKDNADYGFPMSTPQHKQNAELYVKDFLLSERGKDDNGNTVRNLDIIPDRALVQELMRYNRDGNFDRFIGLVGCVIGLEEQFNEYEKERKVYAVDQAAKFFSNNKSLFKNTESNVRRENGGVLP